MVCGNTLFRPDIREHSALIEKPSAHRKSSRRISGQSESPPLRSGEVFQQTARWNQPVGDRPARCPGSSLLPHRIERRPDRPYLALARFLLALLFGGGGRLLLGASR